MPMSQHVLPYSIYETDNENMTFHKMKYHLKSKTTKTSNFLHLDIPEYQFDDLVELLLISKNIIAKWPYVIC